MYRVVPNLSYTPAETLRQQLDLYLPEKDGGEPLPVILIVHGGGWSAGDKGALGGEAWFLEQGYALVRINYRYSSEAKHPAQLDDCRAAVRYLKKRAADFNIDPTRIFLIGHSAGGHLVSLLSCSAYEADGTEVAAVVNQTGPNDFPRFCEDSLVDGSPINNGVAILEDFIGHSHEDRPDLWQQASPIHHLAAAVPCPQLLIYGETDTVVPPIQGRRFYDALKARGANVEFYLLPGANHCDERFWQKDNFERIHRFFSQRSR